MQIDIPEISEDELDDLMALYAPLGSEEKNGIVERGVMQTKWFDYRFLNPVGATYVFAHHYVEAYRLAFRHNIDSSVPLENIPVFRMEPKAEWTPVESEDGELKKRPAIRGRNGKPKGEPVADVFKANKKTIRGIWRARLVADAIGMPYDVFASLALKRRLSYWQRTFLPQPYHLCDSFVSDHVATCWEQFQKEKLFYATHENYKNENYGDLAAQNDHHEWLFAQLEVRGNSPHTLATFMNQNLLPLGKIRTRLERHVLEEAFEIAESNPS